MNYDNVLDGTEDVVLKLWTILHLAVLRINTDLCTGATSGSKNQVYIMWYSDGIAWHVVFMASRKAILSAVDVLHLCREIWCRLLRPPEEGPEVFHFLGQELYSYVSIFWWKSRAICWPTTWQPCSFTFLLQLEEPLLTQQAFPVLFVEIYKRRGGGGGKATDGERSWCHYWGWLSVSAGTHAHIHTCKRVSSPQTKCSLHRPYARIHARWHIRK